MSITKGQFTLLDILPTEAVGQPVGVVAGEDLDARNCVYLSGSNEVKLACANSEDTLPCIGITYDAAANGSPVTVYTDDILGGFSGLIPGSEYYLSQDTQRMGDYVLTKPPGGFIIKLGVAKTESELDINIVKLYPPPPPPPPPPPVFGSEYLYFDSLAESTTSSTTWQQKLRQFCLGMSAGVYRVGWSFEHSYSTRNAPAAAFNVDVDEGVAELLYIEVNRYKDQGDGIYEISSGFSNIWFDAGHHTVDINFKSGSGSNTAYIRNARLEIWRIA